MTVFRWAYHSLLDPGNLLANALGAGVLSFGFYRKVWKVHIKPHLEKTEEIHRHLDPSDPFVIGTTPEADPT